MSRWLNFVYQLLSVGAQVAAPFIVDPHSVNMFHTAVGMGQLAVGVIAHNYNPDGTPATVAYNPLAK